MSIPNHCPDRTPHDGHEWYWRNILRRNCPGLRWVACGDPDGHGPHWLDERRGEACQGLGLAGVCTHGVQMLNACDECETTS